MGTCVACGANSILISDAIGACVDCIRAGDETALETAREKHRRAHLEFGLPAETPRDKLGKVCDLCVRTCRIGLGRVGYCGVRRNTGAGLEGGDEKLARVSAYHDALPTNCVADWVCAGGSECGYPEFSYARGPERGYKNLAVFYEACSFDCLFCQNWHYRTVSMAGGGVPPSGIAKGVDKRTSCICYFGGDPGPQARHALEVSRIARRNNPDRIVRICWETNGSMRPTILDEMVELSLKSGGCIKFDLKAYDENIHEALCGISNARTLANFERACARIPERPDPPPVVASTLLVPGYIDADEVASIAEFIAAIDPDIPYSLLAFHPSFLMTDLPRTSRAHAGEAVAAAHSAGLKRIKIGNIHLLSDGY
jgi:pyruvate formate lyase activating enzyme